ncbi:hypothetical protein DU508_22750 [Pedobacter chinensis]|uniref:Uncharacterized protein n=1 Tax=Pedobacter chinensis TaxID=2282421 RepID=A0A369PUB2_9SPHI|nr:hypothetical protein DU508_22750 [Pedobacter chinensis]
MINLTQNTPIRKLNSVKIGDEIIDDYYSSGKVVKIRKAVINDLKEYLFQLDTNQTIYILTGSN